MRIVLDSNIWISALVFGGNPRKLLETIVADGHEIVVCEELFTEIRRILHKKFPYFINDFEELVVVLKPSTKKVKLGSVSLKVSRDPKDDFVIETAVIGNAPYIISGDKDLLVIGKYESISICGVKSMLKILNT